VPRTPDRRPGALIEDEEIRLITNAIGPTQDGALNYDGTSFVMRDSLGNFNPRSGGGISAAQHKALRDLIHFIDDGPADGFASGAYKETTYSGILPTTQIWYEDSGKTQKIVELTVTYTGILPTTEVWKMYDADGVTLLLTVTDAITYTGVFETTRTRTWV
jgi:hypothetical protein